MQVRKSTTDLFKLYITRMRKTADVRMASAVLQWDQETYMPARGAEIRGQQIASLSELAHELFTDADFGDVLAELAARGDLDKDQQKNIELSLEDFSKYRKYSSEFVRILSEQVNRAFHAWIESRRENAFPVFEKELSTLIELKKQEAEILGYTGHPYNALVNEYEKGCTVDFLDRVFGELLPHLKEIFSRLKEKPQPDDAFLLQHFPRQQQWDWSMFLVKELNFDFESGRQDISEHPFSTSFSSNDVRITTRINEHDFGSMTWSCIHEVGHALYEQGLPGEQYGFPLGEAASLSIHESQSRLWENNVGRSLPFWKHFYPALLKHFPAQLGKVSLESFFTGINKVQPSLIRTEADELTYHFHVMIRYEIEKKLVEGSLQAREIPELWNQLYASYLGISVPDDKQGCLQDVHWSHGSFGYFPTYSLGSLYAAQFFETVSGKMQNLETEITRGNTRGLLDWLRTEIHHHGRRFTSDELSRRVTGKSLDIKSFVNYLLHKYSIIYNL